VDIYLHQHIDDIQYFKCLIKYLTLI